eukprot:scaffold1561_cov129-Cylindrotheca_fusiformis.AAC.32
MKKLFKRSRGSGPPQQHQQHQQQQSTRVRLDKVKDFRTQVIKKTENEYEYIPQECGYDYAPPSLMVPAHSTDSSAVQHHLSSMIYSDEPASDLSSGVHSVQSRHVDYNVRKPRSKSHWRPSEKEQRQIVAEQQKRRRAEKIKEFQRLHGHRPASFLEEREMIPDQRQPHETWRDTISGNDPIREKVEKVLTARDYQSFDSARFVSEEMRQRARYSTGDTTPSDLPSTGNQQYQPGKLIQSQRNAHFSSSRSRGISTIRETQRAVSHPHNEQTDTHRRMPHHTEQINTHRNLSRTSLTPHQHTILNVNSSHGSEENQKADAARERKRSIERSFDDYVINRQPGWIPTELVRTQIVPRKVKNKHLSLSKKKMPPIAPTPVNIVKRVPIAPIVPKKRGILKRILGIGKQKKLDTTFQYEVPVQPAVPSKPKQMQYQPSRSYTVEKVKGDSHSRSATSSTTQTLSYSSGQSYEHLKQVRSGSSKKSDRQFVQSSSLNYRPEPLRTKDSYEHHKLVQSGNNQKSDRRPIQSSLSNPHYVPRQTNGNNYRYRNASAKPPLSSTPQRTLPPNANIIRKPTQTPAQYQPQVQKQRPSTASHKASADAASGGDLIRDHRGAVVIKANRPSDLLPSSHREGCFAQSIDSAPMSPPVNRSRAPSTIFSFTCV